MSWAGWDLRNEPLKTNHAGSAWQEQPYGAISHAFPLQGTASSTFLACARAPGTQSLGPQCCCAPTMLGQVCTSHEGSLTLG